MLPVEPFFGVRGQRVAVSDAPNGPTVVTLRQMSAPVALYLHPDYPTLPGLPGEQMAVRVRIGVGGYFITSRVVVPSVGACLHLAADEVEVTAQLLVPPGGPAFLDALLMPSTVPPRWQEQRGTSVLVQGAAEVFDLPDYAYAWTWSTSQIAGTNNPVTWEFLDSAGTVLQTLALTEQPDISRSATTKAWRPIHPAARTLRCTNTGLNTNVGIAGFACGVRS